MTSLFSKPKASSQSTEAQERTTEIQERQEARLDKEEQDTRRKIGARRRARRTGGARSLLFPGRTTPVQEGAQLQTSLGTG